MVRGTQWETVHSDVMNVTPLKARARASRRRMTNSVTYVLHRISGPRRLSALISVVIIGIGQVWTCLLKHRDLLRSRSQPKVKLLSYTN